MESRKKQYIIYKCTIAVVALGYRSSFHVNDNSMKSPIRTETAGAVNGGGYQREPIKELTENESEERLVNATEPCASADNVRLCLAWVSIALHLIWGPI